jgi:molybdate-binding protein/DNA-binding XRE family transcriptional regulator
MAMILSSPSLLATFRGRHGWSQVDLADKTGVSRAEISAIETGRVVPSVVVALKLAAALGESVEAIFGVARGQESVPWAWPSTVADGRVWRATINGRVFVYPVEETAAGMIPHDGSVTSQRLDLVTDARPERTLVVAGCDPLAGVLAHEMAERHGIRVLPLLRSSTEALDLLKRGLIHVAGVHWANDEEPNANTRVVRERLGRGYALVHQVRWDTGIAVAASRPERQVRELLRANVQWVNREKGSAARQALDRLLGRRARPSGYTRVVRDHRSVAAAVSQGFADAGVCMRAMAFEARIGFLTLSRDAYELCVPESLMDDPRIVALSATLRSQRYRQWMGDVPGCVARDTGAQSVVR